MFFNPLSTWLVVLIADGVIIADEKFGGNSAQTEYERECVTERNTWLNNDIRRIKRNCVSFSPVYVYEKIKSAIDLTMKAYPFNCGRGHIVFDKDNQKYIIEILERCSDFYSTKSQQKAVWYKEAANEARGLEKKYEEMQKREKEEKEKRENKRFIFTLVGAAIVTILAELLWA